MDRSNASRGRATDVVEELGPLAFASRLKRLHERLAKDAGRVYSDLGFRFHPRWFLSVYSLHVHGPASVTELAARLGLSHAAINQTASELIRAGWLAEARHRGDVRKRILRLTRQGKTGAKRLEAVWEDIRVATVELFREAGVDPLPQLTAIERALDGLGIYGRVRRVRGESVDEPVQIMEYRSKYKKHFSALNRAWLAEYFEVEPEDERLLADPKRKIIDRGGAVLFAEQGGRVVGTCALIRHSARDFELAKMAVDPQAQRQGIGRKLADAIIERARRSGGKRLFLLTSDKLKAARRLYVETGFKPAPLPRDLAARYRRCTIAMDLDLHGAGTSTKRRIKDA